MANVFLIPCLGSLRARAVAALFLFVSSLVIVAMPRSAYAIWPFSTEEPPVGSPQWWKKHQSEKVFDAEMGYRIPGVDGYFDGNGRPIQGPVSTEAVLEAVEKKDDTGLIPALDPRVGYEKMKTAVG